MFVAKEPGASTSDVKAELQQAVDAYRFGKVQTRDEYIDEQAASIDSFINLVYGLLALSVFIAAFGILHTMLLSVFERRRELGLSRAVGMSKRQVRSMVRWEAVITSLLGALQGVIVGIALGYAVGLGAAQSGVQEVRPAARHGHLRDDPRRPARRARRDHPRPAGHQGERRGGDRDELAATRDVARRGRRTGGRRADARASRAWARNSTAAGWRSVGVSSSTKGSGAGRVSSRVWQSGHQ